jgi:hypothetical protein
MVYGYGSLGVHWRWRARKNELLLYLINYSDLKNMPRRSLSWMA